MSFVIQSIKPCVAGAYVPVHASAEELKRQDEKLNSKRQRANRLAKDVMHLIPELARRDVLDYLRGNVMPKYGCNRSQGVEG